MKINEAEKLAQNLMKTNGLGDWYFVWDNSVRRFGSCKRLKRVISISKPLAEINDEKEVRDTILHEIAHAKAGMKDGHNLNWKIIALSIGCNGRSTYSSDLVKPVGGYKYQAACSNGHQVLYYRKPKARMIACARCCKEFNRGRFSPEFRLHFEKVHDER